MATKKSAWKQSEFGKITLVNFFNAGYHAIIASGTLYFAEPATSIQTLCIMGASTFFFSIFKSATSNANGVPFVKEQ